MGACYEIKKSVGRTFDTSRCRRKWFSISYAKRKIRNCDWLLKRLGEKNQHLLGKLIFENCFSKMCICRITYHFKFLICDELHDSIPFVQFKKREEHPWRSVTFSKSINPPRVFSRFFNCRNGTESRKTSHITCLARPYHFKFFKGCLPQILLRHSWILCHILCSCHLTLLIFDFYCHPHTAKHWKRNFHTNIFLRNCMTSVTSFYTFCSGFWGYGQTFLFFSQTM